MFMTLLGTGLWTTNSVGGGLNSVNVPSKVSMIGYEIIKFNSLAVVN